MPVTPRGRCHCTPEQINRYRMKLSGPLLDRIDMHITVPALAPGAPRSETARNESSLSVQQREIGRAAGRERGKISGVAVSLQKKDGNARFGGDWSSGGCSPDLIAVRALAPGALRSETARNESSLSVQQR